MLWPLRETLKLIERDVPSPVIPPTALSHVETIATLLPTVTSACYWECRLAAGVTQVDFLTCVEVSGGGREMLASWHAGAALPSAFTQTSIWNRAGDFFTQWADPNSILHECVPLIWLEFDQVDGPLPRGPLPSVSFCLDPEYADRRSWKQFINPQDPQTRWRVAEQGLQFLLGGPLSPHQQNALRACFEALPVGGRIIHLSAMMARSPAVVKVYGAVPQGYLSTYLTRIGWPGSTTELVDSIAPFCTPATVDHNMYIDLTVGEGVMPKLGIAFSQQQIAHLPQRDPTRHTLLALCAQAGLCTTEKRDALCAWPGNFRATFPGEQWPTRMHKWLDVKLVYQPQCPLEAKGYLGFMPQFSLLSSDAV